MLMLLQYYMYLMIYMYVLSVCHDIDQWPYPEAGHTLQLPLMGNVMQVNYCV